MVAKDKSRDRLRELGNLFCFSHHRSPNSQPNKATAFSPLSSKKLTFPSSDNYLYICNLLTEPKVAEAAMCLCREGRKPHGAEGFTPEQRREVVL